MAKLVKGKNGYVMLLTPREKAKKYRYELRHDVRTNNRGAVKPNEDGSMNLAHGQKSYRWGYLDHQKDNAKAHAYMQNKKKSATKTTAPKRNYKKKQG
jgi:hypothetical protein